MRTRKRVWLSRETYAKLEALATLHGVSMDKAISIAIAEPVSQHEDLIGERPEVRR